MSYQIQFLNDQQFEALPGRDMGMKVGIAYPSLGRAYVRESGIKAIDIFNAAHELEHLKGEDLDEHFDSENGCFYKNIGDVVRSVAPLALGIFGGPLLGGLGSALSGAGSSIAGGLGAISPALGGAAASIGAPIAGAGRALGGMLGIGGGGGGGAAGTTQGAIESMSNNLYSNMGGNVLANSPSEIFSQSPNVFSTGAGGLASQFGGAAQDYGVDALSSMFSPMSQFQMPDSMGSFNPDVYQTPGANVIPGQSGEGSGGLAGGAPGATGAGGASKIKAYLQNQGSK